jgi:hypothetical protein
MTMTNVNLPCRLQNKSFTTNVKERRIECYELPKFGNVCVSYRGSSVTNVSVALEIY